ncbi:probable receptor-like protein kinase At5g61350 [Vigna radiata var. radiata]|uniref:Probable receptor-like protein kinase At5g61350 n=1 Tax=Vigna radiata var. radiata TaxID=3916 RepID=A0A1S3UKS3_VIGRR|nr:probable receptor-like protein kinase At5g61350 [Vigna radiata var. radiata]
MDVENKGTRLKPTFLLFLVILHLFLSTLAKSSFTPHVNYLLDCGSSHPTQLTDGRTFKSDRQTTSLLATAEDVQISLHSNLSPSVPSSLLPLYQTARVFQEESTYSFYISKTSRLWVRLYFFPLSNPSYNLTTAVFSVQTNHHVLLHEFSARNNDSPVFKEYLVNVSDSRFSLKFKPKKSSFAFINAIEVVSAPDALISDSATALSPLAEFKGLFNSALEVSYRINVGGPTITPDDDTLARTWETDGSYNIFPQGSETISVSKKGIKYPDVGVTPSIAPNLVYASAVHVKNATFMRPNFNLSWMVNVERSYSYLIRMHFCDILSRSLNQLYFNVYINGIEGVSALNLSSQTKALATAFYQDFVLNARDIINGSILVQVGPTNLPQGTTDAILNGFEVMKISNIADSLDGLYSVDGKYKGPCSTPMEMKILAYVGLALAVTTILLLVITCTRWRKRPQGWENHSRFSSCPLPVHSPISCSSKSSCRGSTASSSRKSNKHGNRVTPQGPKRFFPFSEMRQATNNFEEKRVIGVGGFGKVYLGTLKDGTKVAIKRGSGNSEQGINEFRTELEMLSKLRHRHLVSLIGFCDENSEMVLVYEYMANGPFRSHIYGFDLPCLSWQKRLEICIGAARGLYYLHTGAAQSITHRDVKTTNILLDENYVAKVSDFGLSKVVPDEAQVSTAVKGSFGYLDPEYYRSQQLTQKSDIYSFGVVLFEVLCARPVICPTRPTEEINLAEWAKKQHRRGLVNEIIDQRIAVTMNPQSLSVFVEIAEKCLADCGVDRPSMGDVLWHLEYALRLQEAASRIDEAEDKRASIATNEDLYFL